MVNLYIGLCDKVSISIAVIKSYLRIHVGEKSYLCNDKSYTGEKSYKCSKKSCLSGVCGEDSLVNSDLLNHQKIHIVRLP